MPDHLMNLETLEIRSLGLNSLEHLSKHTPHLKNLTIKFAEIANLKGLPESLSSLESLVIISDEQLKSLEGLPKELPNLRFLKLIASNASRSIRNFSLKGLPTELPNLRTLIIEMQTLGSLIFLSNMCNLIEFKIQGCLKGSLEGFPKVLPKLKKLDILECDLQSLNFYQLHCQN